MSLPPLLRRALAVTTGAALSVVGIGAVAPPASAVDCTTVAVTSESFTLPAPVTAGSPYCLDLSSLAGAGDISSAADWAWSDESSTGSVDITSDWSAADQVLVWTPLGQPRKGGSHLSLSSASTTFRIDYTWAAPTLAGEPAFEVFREDGNPAYPNSRPSQDGGWWNDALITIGQYPTVLRQGDPAITVPLQVACSNPGYDAQSGSSGVVLKLWDLTTSRYLWPADVATSDVGWDWGALGDGTTETTSGAWTQTGSHWTWNGTMTFGVPADAGWHTLAVWSYGAACNGGGIFTYASGLLVVDPHGVADTASTPEGTPVTIDVLSNDPQGSVLGTISAQPGHGTATVVDGGIEYTPEPGFTGTDAFAYTVDGVDGDVQVTVTVTSPAPGAPQSLEVDDVTSTSISVSWQPPAQVGAGVAGYVVFVSPAGEDEFEAAVYTSLTSAVVDGLQPGTAYDIAVETVADDAQSSEWSTTTATTDAGSIAPVAPARTVATGSTTRLTVSGVSPEAIVTLGPLARGVASASVSGLSVTVRTSRGFSGIVSQPVVVTDGGASATLHLRITVNPALPVSRSHTPSAHGRTTVRWAPSAGATGYVVTVDGHVVCRVGARSTSCLVPTVLGPRATVLVAARGADATSSAARPAAYRAPRTPVVVASIGFGTAGMGLTTATRAQVRSLARQLAHQGLTRFEVRGHAASVASDPASRAAQVRASRIRALAVGRALRSALHAAGVHATVRIVWSGADHPIADNLAFNGRIQNRRADVLVL